MEEWARVFDKFKQSLNRIRIRARPKGSLKCCLMPKENICNDLYERAKNGERFTNLMPLVLSRENILLAYRNIKNNTGSKTAGTDKLTIADISKLTTEEFRQRESQ